MLSLLVSLAALLSLAACGGSTGILGNQASAAQATWQNISPPVSYDPNNPIYNFGADTVVVDPQHAHTIYVGTCYQGLWKSVDGGQSWAKVNTGSGGKLLDSGRLWTLAIDPVNSQILYTTPGYGSSGILKSTDGGVSWTDVFGSTHTRQLTSDDIYSIAIDPGNHTHLLAAFHGWWGQQSSGLVESTDSGASWSVIAPAGSWGAGNSVWFVTSQIWLVGTQGDGIWRTTNSGASWSQISTENISHGGINAFYHDPQSGSLYLVASTKILESTDRGASWQDISNGLHYASYVSIVGDGTTLYTSVSFPSSQAGDGTWYSRPTSGGSWQVYGTVKACNAHCNGPAMMAYDPVDHTVYSANWDAGVWRLQLRVPLRPSRLVIDERGYGSHQTGLFRVPARWKLTWSYTSSKGKRRQGFQVAVHRTEGQRAASPSVRGRASSGKGSRVYNGSGLIYLKVGASGSWRIQVWRT